MRDVNFGWLIRYTHANVASFFFILVYLQYKFIISLTNSLNSFIYYLYKRLIGSKFGNRGALDKTSRKDINSSKTLRQRPFYNFKREFSHTIKDRVSLNDLDFLQWGELDPYWVSGFADGESCFSILVLRSKEYKIGFQVRAFFTIGLSINDKILLYQIQKFFGNIGSIRINKKNSSIHWIVSDIKQLTNIIIPHFIKYPLITQKAVDFELFKLAVELINAKAHLTLEGFHKILSIKGSMNLGLSQEFQILFPNILPIEKPIKDIENILNPNWLAGFTTGEGCFDILISKSKNYKIGFKTQLRFRIAQHCRDKVLLTSIVKYLNCGTLYKAGKSGIDFTVTKLSDLNNIIIPFFEKYPLYGLKLLNYFDWCKIAQLINAEAHLTSEGFNLIRSIKSKMNSKRQFDESG